MRTTNAMDIAARAMLVRLSVRTWDASCVDKEATRKTIEATGAADGAGAFRKQLLSKSVTKVMQAAYGAARNEHYAMTLPWSDSGDRILSAAGFERYSRTMSDWQSKCRQLTEEFIQNYSTAIEDAKRYLLGDMFDESKYPAPSEIRDKFELSWKIRQIPVSGDFRVELSDNDARQIRQQIEADLNETLVAATEAVIGRVRVAVTNMRDKLEAYQPSQGKGTRAEGWFKDSLVENVRELVDLMPSLNITGDKRLFDIADMMRSDLIRFDADQLKTSDGERENTAKAADRILSTMEEYGL